jgi:dethiobiotin synthetase
MSAFFVTATGTDIGKTFVTAGLAASARIGFTRFRV